MRLIPPASQRPGHRDRVRGDAAAAGAHPDDQPAAGRQVAGVVAGQGGAGLAYGIRGERAEPDRAAAGQPQVEFGTFLLATGRRPGPAEMPPVSYFGFEVIGPRELSGYRGGF
jgi:hypothetical protein